MGHTLATWANAAWAIVTWAKSFFPDKKIKNTTYHKLSGSMRSAALSPGRYLVSLPSSPPLLGPWVPGSEGPGQGRVLAASPGTVNIVRVCVKATFRVSTSLPAELAMFSWKAS